jgi:hypothetical protein
VRCRSDRDCIPTGGACVPGPELDSTLCLWPSSPPLCNLNTDCKGTRVCSPDGFCSPQCRTDGDCTVVHPNGRCRAGACFLAAFGETCGPSLSLCDPRCVDLSQDPTNCGACGVVCDADKRCVAGVCRAQCVAPTTECGIECVDTRTNPAHCGRCGMDCGSSAICRAGACVLLCPGLAEYCSGVCANTQMSALHCGACDNACPARSHATPWCVAGQCALVCEALYGDCDRVMDNGCERALVADAANCGACGNACGAGLLCAQGRCLPTGVVAYWPLDGNGRDVLGGRDLTLVGAAFEPGVVGQALSLDGTATRTAQRPTSDALFDLQSPAFTLSLWVYFNAFSTEQVLIEKFSGSTGPGWTLTRVSATDIRFGTSSGALDAVSSLPERVWHNIVLRKSGTVLTMFVDGIIAATRPGDLVISASPNPLLIGRRNSVDGRGFYGNGRFDELWLVDRAMSNAEILAEYNRRAP